MEAEYNHLNHATWECKYHVGFTPKYRKKLLFGKVKRHLGQVFEREEFDMDRAECRTQDAQFPGSQILGSQIFCHDRWPR